MENFYTLRVSENDVAVLEFAMQCLIALVKEQVRRIPEDQPMLEGDLELQVRIIALHEHVYNGGPLPEGVQNVTES